MNLRKAQTYLVFSLWEDRKPYTKPVRYSLHFVLWMSLFYLVFLRDWLLWCPALAQLTQFFMNPSSLFSWYQTCEHAIWKKTIVPNTIKAMRFVASLPIPGSKKRR